MFRVEVTSSDGIHCARKVQINDHGKTPSKECFRDIAKRFIIERDQVEEVLASWTADQLKEHLSQFTAEELKPPEIGGRIKPNPPAENT